MIGLVCYGFECFLRLFSVPVRNMPLLRPGSDFFKVLRAVATLIAPRDSQGNGGLKAGVSLCRVGLFVCFFNENHRYVGKGRNKEVFSLSGALSYI